MLRKLKVPHTLQWVVKLFLLYMLIFTLFRIGAYWIFNPDRNVEHGEAVSQYQITNVIPAFLLGLLYDARWISIILAPIVVASLVPRLTPFRNKVTKKFWSIYLVCITFLMLFFFGADFGHFSYVRTRLNASALNFYEDLAISAKMIWESYPILWILLGLAIVVIVLTYFINRTYFRVEIQNIHKSKYDYHRRWYLVTLVLMATFIYANFGRPLTTNDSFRRMDDEFKGFLALNPFQNFFTSLKFRNPGFKGNQVDESKRFNHYPTIANLLQLNPALAKDTQYTRVIANNTKSNPNVVLVMCESLSNYKCSMSGNKLNPTPFIKNLTDSSIYFDRCFSASFGTARGLFAWLTGVPDVQLSKFSSRNERAINQNTIINDFKDYNKLYFLGGSTSFNNFKGLISNINDVKIYEESNFSTKKINVWGLSDKDLFSEANTILKSQNKPFFAVIQTAQNHEPYSIDVNDKVFVKKELSKSDLKSNGFVSNEEFNAVRYFDYCVANFMEQAKKEAYFDNTIFVFFGDHGVIGDARNVYPDVWTNQRLTEEHIPLFFYAPKLLAPQVRKEVVSQIDVLPTTAGLAGQTYRNTTLGRDLLDSNKKGNYAFTIFHDAGKIGVVSDSFYYIHNYNTGDDAVYSLIGNEKINSSKAIEKSRQYFTLAEGMYETSKWLLIHNKRKN